MGDEKVGKTKKNEENKNKFEMPYVSLFYILYILNLLPPIDGSVERGNECGTSPKL